MTTSSGVSAPPHPFDIEAYQELSDRANRVQKSFELDAIDRGLDRLLARPDRKKSGKVLAAQLLRDARKHLRSTRREELDTDINPFELRASRPTEPELDELRFAVDVLTTAVRHLSVRQTLALSVHATGRSSAVLGVQARQCRNIITAAHRMLWQSPGVGMAYDVVMGGLDSWQFETVRLLTPLTAAVTLTN